MTPDAARRILGIDRLATAAQIRMAWKAQVRRYHPDRPGGSAQKFMLAGHAYQVLTDGSVTPHVENAATPASKSASRERPQASPGPAPQKTAHHPPDKRCATARRAAVGSAPVPSADMQQCRTRLGLARRHHVFMASKQASGGFYGDPGRTRADAAAGAEHVASRLEMEGRWLLFVVEAPMRRGQNNVALPKGAGAAVISFQAERDGGGRIRLDPATAGACFPWADSVEIAFRAS